MYSCIPQYTEATQKSSVEGEEDEGFRNVALSASIVLWSTATSTKRSSLLKVNT